MAAPVFGFLDLNTVDLLLILAILLLLFGANKLPDLSRSIGTSMRELRKGLNGEDEKPSTGNQKPKNKS